MYAIQGISIKGLRDYQQDSFAHLEIEGKYILVLADGNGEHPGGKRLSASACKVVVAHLAYQFSKEKHRRVESEQQLHTLGIGAVRKAAEVVKELQETFTLQGSATTLTLVLLTDRFVGCFYVGDSPAYLCTNEKIEELTFPVHTQAEALIAEGIPREQIAMQPSLNSILMRCLGSADERPDVKIREIPGPIKVVLGSDGVLDAIPKTEIKDMLLIGQDVTQKFITTALANGSTDNCSVVYATTIQGKE